MQIIHNDNKPVNGSFKAIDKGEDAGIITYKWLSDTVLEIDHTEVQPQKEGQGIGKNLVNAVIDFARSNNFKIKPLCPFAKKTMERMHGNDDIIVS